MGEPIVHHWGQSRYIDQTALSPRPHPHVVYTHQPLTKAVRRWLTERWGEPSLVQYMDQRAYEIDSSNRLWSYVDCRVKATETHQYAYAFRSADQVLEFRLRWT